MTGNKIYKKMEKIVNKISLVLFFCATEVMVLPIKPLMSILLQHAFLFQTSRGILAPNFLTIIAIKLFVLRKKRDKHNNSISLIPS